MYLKNDKRFFADIRVNNLVGYTPASKFEFKPWYTNTSDYYDIDTRPVYLSVGGGLEYKTMYAGLRYSLNQNILPYYGLWYIKYMKLSFVVGYKIVKTGHR